MGLGAFRRKVKILPLTCSQVCTSVTVENILILTAAVRRSSGHFQFNETFRHQCGFWKEDELPKEEKRYTTAVSQMHPHSL